MYSDMCETEKGNGSESNRAVLVPWVEIGLRCSFPGGGPIRQRFTVNDLGR